MEANEVEEGKITFNKDTAKKLHDIDLMIAKLIYDEIEKLELDEINKIMAHYYIAKNYFDGVQKTMKSIGIEDVIVNIRSGL